MSASRQPALDTDLIVLILLLQGLRTLVGQENCERSLVGFMRESAGPIAEDPATFRGSALDVNRDQARHFLAGICKDCPFLTCKKKDWGMA